MPRDDAPASGLESDEPRAPRAIVIPDYRQGSSYRVAVPHTDAEVELFTTDQQGPATGLDVIVSPADRPDLLVGAIVRVYQEVDAGWVLIPESVRSIIVDPANPNLKTRATSVRNRVANRFRATIQGRLRADARPSPIVNVTYGLTGREPHPSDASDPSEWTADPGVTGNTGVLLAGAGACLQAYFVNNSGTDTFVMLFKAPTYFPVDPNPGDPFFAVLPCAGSGGGWCSFDFVRKGQRYLNGVTFGCSSVPNVYTPDAAVVTGFAEGG